MKTTEIITDTVLGASRDMLMVGFEYLTHLRALQSTMHKVMDLIHMIVLTISDITISTQKELVMASPTLTNLSLFSNY
jgi:hypothetical protein